MLEKGGENVHQSTQASGMGAGRANSLAPLKNDAKKPRSPDQPAWSGDLPPELMAAVVDELRQIAQSVLGVQANGHTLQPTAIVNEVWLRLARHADRRFPTREAFFAFAAKSIRTILVDHARQKNAVKRGGGRSRRSFIAALEDGRVTEPDLLELEDELNLLESLHPVSAQILEMRLYGGMTDEQIALRLGTTERTVRRHARVARLFMKARWDEDDQIHDDG